jgi:peptide-methionine (R)-S-oxide reductase
MQENQNLPDQQGSDRNTLAEGSMTRRNLFSLLAAAGLASKTDAASQAAPLRADIVPLRLSTAQWRERLSPQAYAVLREEATERPGSSPLNAEKRKGLFACAGCDLPLFTSAMKYESGTGWPSFFTTIPGVFGTTTDYKLIYPRTEYHCIRCGGHHGHIFDDGPPPTGKRYCNNGVALRFEASST